VDAWWIFGGSFAVEIAQSSLKSSFKKDLAKRALAEVDYAYGYSNI